MVQDTNAEQAKYLQILEENEQIQNKLKLSIEEFIGKNQPETDRLVTPLNVAVYYLFGGEVSFWHDHIAAMRDNIKAITQVFITCDEASCEFRRASSMPGSLGATLTNLTEFLYIVENPLALAEIDLASLADGLHPVETLKKFNLPYSRP